MKDEQQKISLEEAAEKFGIGRYVRHVFLCVGEACTPDREVAAAAWDALKDGLKAKGLSMMPGPNECYRTKVSCLRLCQRGPVAVVYPEGVWYADMDAEAVRRLIDEHLIGGEVLGEKVFARNPLGGAD